MKSRKELAFLHLLYHLTRAKNSLDNKIWLVVEEKEKGLKSYKDLRERESSSLSHLFKDIFPQILSFIFPS